MSPVDKVDHSLTDERAQTLRHEIVALNRRLDSFDTRRRQLKEVAAAINEEIKLTDWVLTGRRAVGRRYEDDKALRTSLFKRLYAADAEIAAIDEQASPVKVERDSLNVSLSNRIAELRPPRTVESVQVEIDRLRVDLERLEADRPKLDASLAIDMQTHMEVEAALTAEIVASQQLEALRGQAFLAKGNARSAAEQRVVDADLALTIAQEKAAGARAARSHVEEGIGERREALERLNSQIADVQKSIDDKIDVQRRTAAWTAWAESISSLLNALHSVLDVDRERGRRLVDALRYEGLRVFDHRGFLVLPSWLERGSLQID